MITLTLASIETETMHSAGLPQAAAAAVSNLSAAIELGKRQCTSRSALSTGVVRPFPMGPGAGGWEVALTWHLTTEELVQRGRPLYSQGSARSQEVCPTIEQTFKIG